MKNLCCLFLFCVMLFTAGCAQQQAPTPTVIVSPSPEIVPSSSPTPVIHPPTQAVSTAISTATPTSTPWISETPTVFAYTPEPTPLPPDMSRLQVINKTNLKQLVPVWRLEPPFPVTTEYGEMSPPVFSPDSKQLLIRMNNQAFLMELSTSQILQTYSLDDLIPKDEQPMISGLTFSPDGKKIAGITRVGPVLWDAVTGKALWKADWTNSGPFGTSKPTDELYTGMVFSPDGSIIVTTSVTAYSDIRIWSVKSGRMVKKIGQWNQLAVQFSRDGTRLFTADRMTSEEAIMIWDTASWTKIGHVSIDSGAVDLVSSKSGEIMAITSSYVDGPTSIKLYRVKDWSLIGEIRDRDHVDYVPNTITTLPAFDMNGEIIAYTVDDIIKGPQPTIKFADINTHQILYNLDYVLPKPVRHLTFSPDGKLLMAQAENGTTLFYGVPVE